MDDINLVRSMRKLASLSVKTEGRGETAGLALKDIDMPLGTSKSH